MKRIMLLAGITSIASTSVFAMDPVSQPSAMPSKTTNPPTISKPAISTNAASPSNATGNTPINCQYHIPPETQAVDTNIITQWANHVAEQSFDFSHANIDNELSALKTCFTDQGWQSFYDAFLKSGNLSSIKNEKLMVSSVKKGQSNIETLKDNQWRVTVPLDVVYRNTQEKITQTLSVRLLITRKSNGDLGVVQIIAMPQKTAGNTH